MDSLRGDCIADDIMIISNAHGAMMMMMMVCGLLAHQNHVRACNAQLTTDRPLSLINLDLEILLQYLESSYDRAYTVFL
jgi:hypothetical protein